MVLNLMVDEIEKTTTCKRCEKEREIHWFTKLCKECHLRTFGSQKERTGSDNKIK